MKNIFLALFALIPILFTGCANGNSDNQSANNNLDKVVVTKDIVENNSFIDVDLKKLGSKTKEGDQGSTQSQSKDYKEEWAMAKAAIYRFYSNVKIEGDKYVQTVKSGKELNMSESVYETLLENLEDMNRIIKEAKEKGQAIEMPEVTEEYLNSLLK